MPATDHPKILFLTRSLDFGGAQRQLVELACGLHHAGWAVKVVTFYPGGELARRLHDEGVATVSLNKAGRWDVFRFFLRLVRLLRAERPDIAHGYLDLSNILLTAARWCVPHTRIVWGVRASNMDGGRYDALFRIECRLSVLLSRFADLIICNSHAGLEHHASEGFSRARMVVVPNGIDASRFRPDEDARRAVRAEWNIKPDEQLIGLIGRLDPMKDQTGFTRAAGRVAAACPNAKFVCVGDGPAEYRAELVQLARALGIAERMIWSPARTDVWRVHNALDVAVSASSFGEGFSNTIAEAMATGVPCVVTDVGDSARLLGGAGWVCPPDNPEALANAIVAAIETKSLDSATIRHKIVANYSSADLVNRSVAHFRRLLGDARVLVNVSAPRTP